MQRVPKHPTECKPQGTSHGDEAGGFCGSAADGLMVTIEVQGHLVEGHVRGGQVKGGGRRGAIGDRMSRSSRKRYLAMIERLEYREDLPWAWSMVTVTYPPETAGAFDGKRAARDLEVFWKRLERTSCAVAAIWVKELQPGRGAIHFHLLVYGRWLPHSLVAEFWQEVIGSEVVPICWVEKVRSWKAALKYAAKYMGKAAGEGRRGGGTRDAGVGAATEAGVVEEDGDSSLDPSAYSAVGGRWWGVLGRENLPWGELTSVLWELGDWYYRWRRAARRSWEGVSTRRQQGFSLFVGDPGQWLALAAWFQGQDCPC